MKDKIVIFNIPPVKHRGFRRAILSGLEKLRNEVSDRRSFQVLIYSITNDENKEFLSGGTALGPDAIMLDYNLKKFSDVPEKKRLRDLEGSVIHEAVHALRYNKKIATVRHALLNEGISCFVQVTLSGQKPLYLDFGETYIEDIEKWWHWWNRKYFSRPANDPFFNYRTYEEAAYRIGYYIVSSYFDAHQSLTIEKLIGAGFRKLELFAKKLFAIRRS